MNYIHSVRRYWWVALAGLAMACLTGILLLYQVQSIAPPKLVKRAKPVFAASTELLVDSPSAPYLRTPPAKQSAPKTSAKTGKAATTPTSTTPQTAIQPAVVDTKSLINAANLFPLFVESDAVVAIRRKLIGDIPGVVQAKALYSTTGANRFRPSPIPVLQIFAVAPRAKFAIALTDGTARAFEIWLERRQASAGVPREQRIVVRQLHAPGQATATGGTSYGLPAVASLAVLALFIGLAIVLDQRVPARGVSRELRPLPTGAEDAAQRHELGGRTASGGAPDKPLA
jgi:hypothetical protein